MPSPDASTFRDRMLEALNAYMAHKDEVARIKARVMHEVLVARETRPRIGGQQNPLGYDVDVALSKHYFFVQARSDRDAARWNAIMWGVAALVEAQES